MSKEHVDEHFSGTGLSTASLVLGILAIATSLVSLIGITLGVLAIIFGITSSKKPRHKKAKAGIVTGSMGIILSLVFVFAIFAAVPSLQMNQRNTARKNDASRIMSDISNYQSNNKGQVPEAKILSTTGLSQINLIKDQGEPTIDSAVYIVGVNCNNEFSVRTFSLTILLEGGSDYCLDL